MFIKEEQKRGIQFTSTSLVIQFEYGPFGELIRSSGTPPCNFGFSTKYRDSETGLNYYGYRYYSAGLGRWLGRDPIQEVGSIGLYLFCNNNHESYYDVNGLYLVPRFIPPPTLVTPRTVPVAPPPIHPLPISPDLKPDTDPSPSHNPYPNPSPNPQKQERHAGNFHVQLGDGDFKEETITRWEQNYPLSKGDGVLIIMAAYNKAPKSAKKDLQGELQKAIKWINSVPAYGHNASPPLFKSWPDNGGRCWHIDLELLSGTAFISKQPEPYDYDPKGVF